jgi:2-C-methyl-D-erythritol 4-phosphate cytidylyltransferase
MAGPVWAIVVAAGRGTRFGGLKQFASVGERTVADLAVEAVAAVADGVVLVVPPDFLSAGEGVAGVDRPGLCVAAGRATRAGSVRAGLAMVPADCEVVVVHDAARPLASPQLCEAVVKAVRAGADGAIPGVPIHDTVKRVAEDVVVETLDRSDLVRVQTPQAFSAPMLRRAHEGEPEATDDAGLVEKIGGRVVVVPGEEANVKITGPDDLHAVTWWATRP